MQRDILQRAKEGESLWLPDLRELFAAEPDAERVILRLSFGQERSLDLSLPLPPCCDEEETRFVFEYAAATVYNLLSAYSGRELCFFCAPEAEALLRGLPELFASSRGYGKVLNIARRIHGGFTFRFAPFEAYAPLPPIEPPAPSALGETLRRACRAAEQKGCAGVDVGGSDIKLAVSLNGQLLYTEEYDWNPSASTTSEGILAPILGLVETARTQIERRGGTLDAVGISFPDVVIGDAIVGGETPKTKGLRDNPTIEYESEFARLRALKNAVLPFCSPGASVHLANDGSIAAFTAAMELAAGGEDEQIRGGVLAHSLGTDLGTGWLKADGTIPPLPLEMYDLLLDLGDFPSAALPPEDLRSTRNENSGMPGVRRYLGQAAAYRLAWAQDPGMLDSFARQSGGLLTIPTAPEDLRKPCLAHLMDLAASGKPEAEAVFRQIGRNLAVVAREMAWLFGETPSIRFLFGRFVKSPRCFALLCEGFEQGTDRCRLAAADDTLSNSPLMRQLAARQDVTVAQFGQAVGAIYYSLV